MSRLAVVGVVLAAFVATAVAQDQNDRAQAAAFVKLLGDKELGPIAERSLKKLGAASIPALIAALHDANALARPAAARLLRELGKESDTARTALKTAVGDRNSNVRLAACRALMALGDNSRPVVEGIASCLTSADRDVRRMAATALKGGGEHLKPAIPALLRALSNRDEVLRRLAGDALADKGVAAVDALGAGTRSDSPIVRAAAVRALGGMGAKARQAVPQLVALLGDTSLQVRVGAANALGRIGKDATDAAKPLKETLTGRATHPDLRAAALNALDRMQPQGWDTIRALRVLWRSKQARVRAFAADSLGARGKDSKAALDDLMLGLNDMSHFVRRASAIALARIAPESDEVLRVLRGALKDKFIAAPRVAAEALGVMGRRAKPAMDDLMAATRSDNEELRAAAHAAMARIDR